MVWIFRSLVFVLSFVLLVAKPRIRSMVEICRHGARSPIHQQNPEKWDQAPGQLTPQGERMHYLIGNQLRQTYIEDLKFLDPEFNVQQIYARSTVVNRTIMSARSQLLGLYPPGSGPLLSQVQIDKAVPPLKVHNLQNIQQDLGLSALKHRTSPIPVHTIKGGRDLILSGTRPDCPYARAKMQQHFHTQKYKQGLDLFRDMGVEETIKIVFKLQQFSLDDQNARELADNIIATNYEFPAQNPHNLTQQQLTNVDLFVHYVFFEGDFGNEEALKLSQTALFMDIIQRFSQILTLDKEIAKLEQECAIKAEKCEEAETKERDRLKFTFYSAHDTNIAGISKFLGLVQLGEAPPYASTFFFKLLSKTEKLSGLPQDYMVYIEFNKGIALTFDSFSQFEGFVSDRTYHGDLVKACIDGIPTSEGETNNWQIIIIGIVAALVLAGVIIGVVCYCKRRREGNHSDYPLNEESDRQPQKRESGTIELGNPYGISQL